ncbi:MAG: hypothetical protein IPF98_22725 [Gemmatimonadetes bacterium]|nr:hypothetical protein [Gemmatimonadota bacterium]
MTSSSYESDPASSHLMVRGVFRLPLGVGRRPVQHAVHEVIYAFNGVVAAGATVTEATFFREPAAADGAIEGMAVFAAVSAVTVTPSAEVAEGECALVSLVHVSIDSPQLVFSSAGLEEWVVVIEGVGTGQVVDVPQL